MSNSLQASSQTTTRTSNVALTLIHWATLGILSGRIMGDGIDLDQNIGSHHLSSEAGTDRRLAFGRAR
jgi:hypothetical protein